jgi:2-polyprenyl-6-methoxyphenol hydroxylase-like FAD-dependent oxidoreductase
LRETPVPLSSDGIIILVVYLFYEPIWRGSHMDELSVRCCIVGGGPAGMMLGFLLGRAGIEVVVLEKHADFLRDFRGDTVHPSTLEIMYELGILEEFLRRPHQRVVRLAAQIGETKVWIADLSHLPTHAKFVALMPQWDFLNFLAERGRAHPEFHLRMQAEAVGLIEENGAVTGVRAETPKGELVVHSDLVVGTDGRHSTVREKAGLTVVDKGAPMDVLWMRISRRASDGSQALGRVESGKMLVMIDRGEYWQCAFVIPKGSSDERRSRGIEKFREEIAQLVPFLRDRLAELKDWSDVKLLTVKVDRLEKWYKPGLICIGDAAHAMSPIGGVGINLAVQDAVAAANILAMPLTSREQLMPLLERVQRRREFPTRVTQRAQIFVQDRVVRRILAGDKPITVPWILKLMQRWPVLQRIPARAIGLGVCPEHARTPDVHGRSSVARVS